MEPKDGGPAYPVPSDGVSFGTHPGMSLRDHFAGLAMQGAMVNVTGLGRISADARAKNLAEAAALFYEVADAMLAERERGR